MYAKRVPFTRSTTKGPQAVGKPSKKVAAPKPVVEEPAKIEEVIDLITPAEEVVESVEESTDGVN